MKKFNRRQQYGKYDKHTIFLLAKSQAEAVRLLNECGIHVTATYIKDYFIGKTLA